MLSATLKVGTTVLSRALLRFVVLSAASALAIAWEPSHTRFQMISTEQYLFACGDLRQALVQERMFGRGWHSKVKTASGLLVWVQFRQN